MYIERLPFQVMIGPVEHCISWEVQYNIMLARIQCQLGYALCDGIKMPWFRELSVQTYKKKRIV